MAIKRTALVVPRIGPHPAAGHYFHPVSPHATSTSNTQGNGTLRLAPWLVNTMVAIDRLGADVSVAGEAGSKVRLGIYSDNGHSYPGTLLLDAGQIAGDSATVQELTVALTIWPGLYWIGGVVQSAGTTQPTIRVNANWTPPVPIDLGTSVPSANNQSAVYSQPAVTAALPSTFTSTVAATNTVPRAFVRIAA